LLNLFRKKESDEIIKAEQKKLDDLIQRSAQLKRFIESDKSGWKEVCQLVDQYINFLKSNKDRIRLDICDEKTLEQLKLADREIFILEWFKKIPEQFIGKVEAQVKEFQKEVNNNTEGDEDGEGMGL
jgi:hypothetical protein